MKTMQKIKEIRKLRGYNQKQLGEMIGTTSVNVSYLEIGKRGLSEEWIKKISEALNCTKSQLLGEQSIAGLEKLPEEIIQDQRTFLHTIRSKKKFSINELAKKVGVSRQAIWNFENGKSTLSKDVFEKIAGVLDVSIEYLTTGKNITRNDGRNIGIISDNQYPIQDQYLGYAMGIVDEVVDPNFYSKEEKVQILSEVYKIVYNFYENNDDKADYVKEIEKKIVANEGFLKFINRINFDLSATNKSSENNRKKVSNN